MTKKWDEMTEREKTIANLQSNHNKVDLAEQVYTLKEKLKELTLVEKKQEQVEKAVVAQAEFAHGLTKLDNGNYALVELSYDRKTGAAVISSVKDTGTKDVQIAYHKVRESSIEKVYMPFVR